MRGQSKTSSAGGVHIPWPRTNFSVERIHGCVEFLNLADLRTNSGSVNEVTTYQYATNDKPDDDQHYRELDECETFLMRNGFLHHWNRKLSQQLTPEPLLTSMEYCSGNVPEPAVVERAS